VNLIRATCAVFLLAAGAAPAAAQDWPAQRIVVVSPFGTGTTYDLVAHTVLDQVAHQIGQAFILENHPGGGGTIGVASVVKAAPDGYTLLLGSSFMSFAAMLHKSLPYDMVRDLAPVAMFGEEPAMLVGAPNKGINSVSDLVAAARAHPGAIKFASVGVGSASFVAGERFSLEANINVKHVPYPGPAEALADMAAGRVDFYFVPVTPALPLITQGKAVPLAVSTTKRLQSLTGLPTLAETGYASIPFLTWCGLMAPAKTPPTIIAKLNKAIGNTLDLPAIENKLLQTGVLPAQLSPQQFQKFLADDVNGIIKLGKEAHIEPVD